VGDDGKTHQGAFDLSYLRSIPNMVVAAPKDGGEFQNLLYTATRAGLPMAIRYPRGNIERALTETEFREIPLCHAEVLRGGQDVALLAIGNTVYPSLEAAEILAKDGIACTVVNARFAKPIDSELILPLLRETKRALTIEENVLAGGFGSAILQLAGSADLEGVKIQCAGLPDEFIEHGPQELLRAKFSLDAGGIARRVKSSFTDLPARLPPRPPQRISQ